MYDNVIVISILKYAKNIIWYYRSIRQIEANVKMHETMAFIFAVQGQEKVQKDFKTILHFGPF